MLRSRFREALELSSIMKESLVITCELSCGVGFSKIQDEKCVCHNQEVQCERATLHPDSTLHCKGERSLEASCLCQLYIERIQRTRPSFGRFYVGWEL